MILFNKKRTTSVAIIRVPRALKDQKYSFVGRGTDAVSLKRCNAYSTPWPPAGFEGSLRGKEKRAEKRMKEGKAGKGK